MSSESDSREEYRVRYINPRAGGNDRLTFCDSEDDARKEARECVAGGCWDVRVERREVGPWQRFAQSQR